MKHKNDRTESAQPRPAETPAPPRRFRIDKLEERIAPAKGGIQGQPWSVGRHTRCCS